MDKEERFMTNSMTEAELWTVSDDLVNLDAGHLSRFGAGSPVE